MQFARDPWGGHKLGGILETPSALNKLKCFSPGMFGQGQTQNKKTNPIKNIKKPFEKFLPATWTPIGQQTNLNLLPLFCRGPPPSLSGSSTWHEWDPPLPPGGKFTLLYWYITGANSLGIGVKVIYLNIYRVLSGLAPKRTMW